MAHESRTRSNPKDTDIPTRLLKRLTKGSNDPRLERLVEDPNPSPDDGELIEAVKGYISTHAPLQSCHHLTGT